MIHGFEMEANYVEVRLKGNKQAIVGDKVFLKMIVFFTANTTPVHFAEFPYLGSCSCATRPWFSSMG
jgi:hypothetical protein